VTASHSLASLRRGGQRGQGIVEFALVAPIVLLLFFAVLESGLLVFTIGAYRYAAAQGATLDAELGNATDADTQAVQVIQSSPGVPILATVTEIDICRQKQSGGQYVDDTTACNKYPVTGTSSVTWPPASRNVHNGASDFLGVTIKYTYRFKSGTLLGAQPLQLTQTFDARIEPQTY